MRPPMSALALFEAIDPRELHAAVAQLLERRLDAIDAIRAEDAPGGCRGYAAPKQFARIDWRAGTLQGSCRIVAKAFPEGRGEAACYRALGRHAILPRVVACRDRRDGTEILLLERLDQVGLDPTDGQELSDLLRSLAVFNAIVPQAALPQVDLEQWCQQTLAILPALLAECRQGFHGRDCAAEANAWPRSRVPLAAACAEAAKRAAICPQGVVHLDPAPQNCGRRSTASDIVLFDLQTLRSGPVVADAACWCEPVACGAVQAADRLRQWCSALVAVGGPFLQPDQAREWADAVQPLRIGSVLGWFHGRLHDGMADFTDDRDAAREAFRGWVCEMLRICRRCLWGGL
ncbi:MAG: hypothetical protein ACOCXA_02595 [Planctomycetota bacterium]